MKYAGIFALIAGDYSKRASLPRDDHGFEPVEGYFNRRRDNDCGKEPRGPSASVHLSLSFSHLPPDSSSVSSLEEELVPSQPQPPGPAEVDS